LLSTLDLDDAGELRHRARVSPIARTEQLEAAIVHRPFADADLGDADLGRNRRSSAQQIRARACAVELGELLSQSFRSARDQVIF